MPGKRRLRGAVPAVCTNAFPSAHAQREIHRGAQASTGYAGVDLPKKAFYGLQTSACRYKGGGQSLKMRSSLFQRRLIDRVTLLPDEPARYKVAIKARS